MPILDELSNDALGMGLRMPIEVDHRGGLAIARSEQKVHESVLSILSTARGERVMRPDFGCDIHKFVFTTVDAVSLTLVRSAVREALLRWEPRIDVKEVEVTVESEGWSDGKPAEIALARSYDAQLRISVTYLIRITNTVANLVYPFYLNSGN